MGYTDLMNYRSTSCSAPVPDPAKDLFSFILTQALLPAWNQM